MGSHVVQLIRDLAVDAGAAAPRAEGIVANAAVDGVSGKIFYHETFHLSGF